MFFDFSISYTILNISLSILYLSIMLFNPGIFFPILPFPADNPPCDLHFYDSVPVLVVCIARFCFFKVQLLIVVSLLSFYCSYFHLLLFLR